MIPCHRGGLAPAGPAEGTGRPGILPEGRTGDADPTTGLGGSPDGDGASVIPCHMGGFATGAGFGGAGPGLLPEGN